MQPRNQETKVESKKGLNLRNEPISKAMLRELSIGFHFHPFANRRNRRTKIKTSNNRKCTLGRLVKKVRVLDKEGKLKTIILENRQERLSPLELKYIAESKENVRLLDEATKKALEKEQAK